MTGTFVFLGPSLPLDEARTLLPEATFLPPVKMGDVQALVGRAPRCICIVDGLFERVPAVWHKEILFALHRGIRVIGASSMGALRAAEMYSLGMEGVGAVFEAYRTGLIEDDDEVALVHGSAEDGYRALSEPLVNIRFALADAAREGVIDTAEAERLLELARATFYPERTWPRLLEEGRASAALRMRIRELRPNIKRDDARLALRACTQEPASVPTSPIAFEPTVFWHRLVATTARAADELPVMQGDVVAHARLTLPDLRDVQRLALLDELIPLEAERQGISVTPEEISAAAEHFRRERGLGSASDTRAWLARQGLDDAGFTQLMRLDALFDKLLELYEPSLRRRGGLLATLRRQGRLGELAAAAEARPRAAARADPPPADQLLAFHAAHLGPIAGSPEMHARRRGFGSALELLEELAAEMLAHDAR